MSEVHKKHHRQKTEFTTLTRAKMHETARERVSVISHEFKTGFEFLEQFPKSVSIFGSARFEPGNRYYEEARTVAGRIVSELGYTVITGGGPGIMEGANRGAFEHKGKSVGLTIELPHEQLINPYLTHHLDFYYFFARKVSLSFAAEAYIFFPGGFGTLDEFFEIATLVQTKKIEKVPIILVGADFWKDVDDLIQKALLMEHTIDVADTKLYHITDDSSEILEIIRHAPVRYGVKFAYKQPASALVEKECVPCEGDAAPLTHTENESYIHEVNQWVLVDDLRIEKILHFKDFAEALEFVNAVAQIAEKEGHHPDIELSDYKKVKITLTTHAINGLSENDFIVAAKIDELLRSFTH